MRVLDKKCVLNFCRVRGRLIFQNSLRRTQIVGKFVRSRVLRNKNCTAPVQCGTANEIGNASSKAKLVNPQQTVGYFVRENNTRDFYKLGFARALERECPVATPEKFFCLPFFNSQCASAAGFVPNRNEDNHEFLFVDPGRFLARNSTSVLHNVIFKLNSHEIKC